MKKISVANGKGGVGKTTTVINLSSLYAKKGKKVLVIDMDNRGNSTQILLDDFENKNDINNVLIDGYSLDNAIYESNLNNLDICGNFGKTSQEYISITDFKNIEQTLNNAINDMKKKYDFVFIDCGGTLDGFTKNALVASDYIIIPIKPDQSAYVAIGEMIGYVNMINESYNPTLKILGILGVENNYTRVYTQTMQLINENFYNLVFNTKIRQSVKVPESSYVRKAVSLAFPYSKPATDYKNLFKEINKLIEKGE